MVNPPGNHTQEVDTQNGCIYIYIYAWSVRTPPPPPLNSNEGGGGVRELSLSVFQI